jgi:hypothetical protein
MAQITVNGAGLAQIMKSDAVRRDLERRAKAVAAAAGPASDTDYPGGPRPSYLVDSQVGRRRARASVRTNTPEAAYEEAVNHSLLRAFDAARH